MLAIALKIYQLLDHFVSNILFAEKCHSDRQREQNNVLPIFFSFNDQVKICKRAIIGPLAKRHSNGVSLAGRWWPDIACCLGSGLVFDLTTTFNLFAILPTSL